MKPTASLTDRWAAILIAVPAIATVVAVMHHPTIQVSATTSQTQILQSLDGIAVVNAAFHLGLMLLIAAQAVGLFTMAEAIGTRSLWVRAGLVLYVAGIFLLFGAASIDGFATPFIAQRFGAGHAAEGTALFSALVSASAAIQGFTRGGLFVQAAGMACWSIALLFKSEALRSIAALGCVVALGLIAVLAWDGTALGRQRLSAFTLLAALWLIGAAACLWLNRVHGASDR